jgi:hypothetical protein
MASTAYRSWIRLGPDMWRKQPPQHPGVFSTFLTPPRRLPEVSTSAARADTCPKGNEAVGLQVAVSDCPELYGIDKDE